MSDNKQYTLCLQLDKDSYDTLNKLTLKSRSVTKVQTIRKALNLLSLYYEVTLKGSKLKIKNSDGTEETIRII